MKKYLTILFLSVSVNLSSQTNNLPKTHTIAKQDSIIFSKNCIAFIKEVTPQNISDTGFILTDKPFDFEYFNCLEYLRKDTATFTDEEISFILNRKYPSIKKWEPSFFEKTRFVSNDSINLIFKDRSKGWGYFYKTIGESYNTFSTPIFLRNDTYCLFYSSNHCGGLCGGGRLTLFKKISGKWIAVKYYCEWIS